MWFRLALRFGVPVGELQERISSAEFTAWLAFFELEPWGYEIDNWRAGMICASTANTAGPKPGTRKPWTAADFMPRRASAPRVQSVDEMRRALSALAERANG